MRRLKPKERFDIATMVYFIPEGSKRRIYPNDKVKMADLSSRGIKPTRETPGYMALKIGKMWRELHTTDWRDGIRDGYITKAELLDDMPPRFRQWLWTKIKDVPYDIEAYEITSWRDTKDGLKPNYTATGRGTTGMLIKQGKR